MGFLYRRIPIKCIRRSLSEIRKLREFKILGIETSCDDTACAIVDNEGRVLGESIKNQQDTTLRLGGVMLPIAEDLHKKCIKEILNDTLNEAKIGMEEVDGIAVTVKPGMALSLRVGLTYGKELSMRYNKPFIPIHHMEAHALTAKLGDQSIEYPFLALLISGGHCLLTLVESYQKFILLGKCLDNGPGEAFDKISRQMKLSNLAKYRNCSGGQAIEDMAKKGNPLAFEFPPILTHYRDCNFSFSGLKEQTKKYIKSEERIYNVSPTDIIPNASNLCASFQYAVAKHLSWRTQRAMQYIENHQLLTENSKTLVVSGGVACNNFIREALSIVCDEMGYYLSVPPPKFCTDNGIMIAWNGVQKYANNTDIYYPDQLDHLYFEAKCPLGEDHTEIVAKDHIKCEWIKFTKLLHSCSQLSEQN